MASVPSKLYSDDVSLLVVLIDTNPFFWGGVNTTNASSSLSFSTFIAHVLSFINSILLLNQLNQVVVIATGVNSCNYIYDSSSQTVTENSENGIIPARSSQILRKLEEFVSADEQLSKDLSQARVFSLLSGSLSLALCYIQRVFRTGSLHPQPRVSFRFYFLLLFSFLVTQNVDSC
ncbi:hypothetical protein AQUCO_00100827v1 [Aquilegia coerulea]|uniref:General transcription and DNA repair factor IIH subunit TFB4 n=1 Tax=Aquilegia coerulea TaxID=218851 RepID=A0A2G5FCG1_AQUCA|nr:hypothetical protein AQUCO_00100827v1 [Aquilegia coerulea]